MNIQINTDRNIEGTDRLKNYFKDTMSAAFSRFESQLTRVIVHLSDENAGKNGPNDKRCVLEVRPESRNPQTVSASGDTIEIAVNSAIDKMKSLLDTEFGKANQVR